MLIIAVWLIFDGSSKDTRLQITKELTKLYYSIGEVAEMFQVSTSLLRYWESEFKSLKPKKNRKGDRQYQVKDIREIEKIYTLVKERGFTLDGAKKELKSPESSAIAENTVLSRLTNLKAKLTKLRASLD